MVWHGETRCDKALGFGFMQKVHSTHSRSLLSEQLLRPAIRVRHHARKHTKHKTHKTHKTRKHANTQTRKHTYKLIHDTSKSETPFRMPSIAP